MSSPETYLCPLCDRNVSVGRNRPCSPRKRKKKKPKEPRKSWEQNEASDGIDLPDDSFDDDEFIAREFGTAKPHQKIGIAAYWWITALILAIVWLLFHLF